MAGYCEGWRRGAAACRRMATPGQHTCTIHRHQEALVAALLDVADVGPAEPAGGEWLNVGGAM